MEKIFGEDFTNPRPVIWLGKKINYCDSFQLVEGIKMQRIRFVFLLLLVLFGSLSVVGNPVSAIDFYLTLDTYPVEVLSIDPEAVTGEGYYESGTWVTIDAKQTIISDTVRYEFVEWSTTDNSQADPEDLEDLTGNQALIMMDSDRTITAIYQPHYTFYLTLDTSPVEVLSIDPEAVTGEGYYESGTWVTIDAKQTIISDTVRYEFVEWSTTDNSQADPEDLEDLTGNQALIMMDSDRTITAIYQQIINVDWEFSFSDDTRETLLKISIDDGYFQFSTPEKEYPIKKAEVMMVFWNLFVIRHSDSDLYLNSNGILDHRIDFCFAYAVDSNSGQNYLLRDRIGLE